MKHDNLYGTEGVTIYRANPPFNRVSTADNSIAAQIYEDIVSINMKMLGISIVETKSNICFKARTAANEE